MSRTLYGLAYSPWTERARWALDHHRIPHRYREHLILIGEPSLRWRSRNAGTSKASVPLFVDGDLAIGDSLAIAQHADAVGRGAPLGTDHPDFAAFSARVETALQAARALVTAAILADPEALRESARAAAPEALTPMMRPVAATAARFIARKYSADLKADDRNRASIREVLTELRQRRAETPYLQGEHFSAFDIWAATLLQGVRPVAHTYIKLSPAVERAWTQPELAREFEDLISWRNRIYQLHRHGPADASAVSASVSQSASARF
ncbi:MAG: glutathione S-transferase [Myxococcales bacterium]|nr:glutathione S-transferase [Myxococcales bacterium]MCB9607146.1 glutathione S-transferase [Polyangiaceae bacterium]